MQKGAILGVSIFVAMTLLMTASQQIPPFSSLSTAHASDELAPIGQLATPAPDQTLNEARIEVVATPAPIMRPTRAVITRDPTLFVAGIGDSLSLLSAHSGFSVTDLAQRNRLTQSNVLLVGQQVRLPQAYTPRISLHRVAPNDTLISISAQYGIAPYIVQQMNSLPCAECLIAGQLLRIPQTKADSNLPYPLTHIDIDPPSPIAGEVVSIRIFTAAPLKKIEGKIDGEPLHFFYKGDGTYIAILGISALQKAETVPVVISSVTDSDAKTDLQARLSLTPHNYGFQNVFVSNGLLPLLNPKINNAEQAHLAKIYSKYTNEQWWDGTFRSPAYGDITSTYGARRNFNGGILNTYHSGIDFRAFVGTPIQSAAAGKVVAIEQLDVRGLVVIIDHGRGVFTAYCHLSEALVKVGQMVSAGETIAKSGNTGRTEGPHLHWEVAVGGVQVNPITWLGQPIQ
jgi:murein DD-endopeptidase MepM/ murein hydrolase activator NlpD